MTVLFLSAVFVSGFCSLVYQLVWDRLARYNFGGDNVSATIVVTTFMLGLGLGAFLFRRPSRKPLKAYGIVEIAIGLFATVSPYVISNISLVVARVFPPTATGLEGVRMATIAGCAAFLLPPCILMGATLPMMFASFFRSGSPTPGTVGLVYGVNVLGAMTGTVAAPTILLNQFPIDRALQGTGCLSLLAGFMALALHARSVDDPPPATQPGDSVAESTSSGALTIAAVTGAVTIVFELMLIRHAVVTLPSTVYTFSFVLFAVLLSLGVGSLVLPRLLGRPGRASYVWVAVLLLLAEAGLVVSLRSARHLILQGTLLPDLVRLGTTGESFILLAAPLFVAMGAVFPILCAAGSTTGESLSKGTGGLYLANSLGAGAGAVLYHTVLTALWGTRGSFLALTIVLGAAAALAVLLSSRRWFALAAIPAAIALVVIAARVDVRPFIVGPLIKSFPHITLVEGSSGMASVNWYDAIGNGGAVVINGQSMGAVPNEPQDMRVLAGALTVAYPRRILVLGVANGAFIAPLLDRPETESLTLVDWSHEIQRLMRTDKIFVHTKDMVARLKDPRVHFIVADARVAVTMFPDRSFDLVLDTLARPTWPGATGLRSPSHLKQVARILTDDGVLALGALYRGWEGGAWSQTTWRRTVFASVLTAFDYAEESPEAHVLIASKRPIAPPSDAQLARIAADLGDKTRLDAAGLRTVLTTGFSAVSRDDVRGVQTFSERSVRSEYYYSPLDILRLLRK